MTPHKKAIDLVDEFYNNIEEYPAEIQPQDIEWQTAKKCALISVNLILDSDLLEPQLKRHYVNGLEPKITELEYWQQVKEEINKL